MIEEEKKIDNDTGSLLYAQQLVAKILGGLIGITGIMS